MPYTTSILPADIRDGGWLTSSGLYELTITAARHPQAAYSPDGRIWDRMVLSGHVPAWPGCSVRYRVEVEVELPQLDCYGRTVSSAPHCEALCFFLNLRDRLGRLSLPDPVEVTLPGRHGGRPRVYEHWPQLERTAAGGRHRVHLLIACRARHESDDVPQYRLIGFCDCRGRSARDVAEDRDINERHRSFMLRCAGGTAVSMDGWWTPSAPHPLQSRTKHTDSVAQPLAFVHD